MNAGIPYTLLLRIEAIGFPTFRLLLYRIGVPLRSQYTLFRCTWAVQTSQNRPEGTDKGTQVHGHYKTIYMPNVTKHR